MGKELQQVNQLHGLAQFTLFVSSYLPLFLLLILKQAAVNWEFLHWGGFNFITLELFLIKFGLSAALLVICLFGWFGYRETLANIEQVAANGFPILVKDVKNKNSEAIGYIATYIIPFLFQDINNWYETVSIFFLLLVIYRIYINSSLLLINPILSLRFSIYEIEYEEKGRICSGLIISRNKFLQDGAELKLYEIGHELFFATPK